MDSNTNVLYSAAGLPALISTGITFIYFLLKACRYLVHAISHKTEGRVATPMPGCGEQKHSADTRIQGRTEVREQVSGHSTEQYGGGTQRSPGSIFCTKKEARPMPPFPWRCSRVYRGVHFSTKCKKTARRKASRFPRI